MSRTKPSYLRESVIKSHSHLGAWAPKIDLCASLKSAEEEAAQPAKGCCTTESNGKHAYLAYLCKMLCHDVLLFSARPANIFEAPGAHRAHHPITTQATLSTMGPRLWKHHQYPTESYWYIRVGEQKFLESKEATWAPCVCLCTRSWAKPSLS